jgi:hypothetical protein
VIALGPDMGIWFALSAESRIAARKADDWLRREKARAASRSSKEPSVIGAAISTSLPTRKIIEGYPIVIFGCDRAQRTPSRTG